MVVARLAREDEPMLRGAANFVADLAVAGGTVHAEFVRSTEPHGLLRAVDVEAAAAAPGVVAVVTGEDLDLAAHSYYPATTSGGVMARPLLATDRVRFVGEPVAVVLAESPVAAQDAAELVDVEVEALMAVIDPQASAGADAPLLFPENGSNAVAVHEDDAPDPLAGAAFVGKVTSASPRVTSAPIEPCGIVATPAGEGLDVWCTGQGVHRQHDTLVEVLGLDPTAVRVRHPHVGGGFGGRGDALPEFLVVAALALRVGRPIRWVQHRAEQFASMPWGRGQVHEFAVGLDRDGYIVGVDAQMWCDSGAYPHMAAVLAMASRRQCTGMYRVPRFRYRFASAVTNTPPVGAYRGAGQPEVNLALERALDAAARQAGLDPVEVRRTNLLRPEDLPYDTGTGVTVDSGDAVGALDAAETALADAGWPAEVERSRAGGGSRLVGIGYGCYSQTAGSGDAGDYAHLELLGDGSVLVSCASAAHGQGHDSLWTAMVTDRLGLDAERVRVVDADSAAAPFGQTTGGSRSSFVLGSQIAAAADELFERARLVAANLLEAHPDDVVASEDGWAVVGVPARLVSWEEVGAAGDGLAVSMETRIGGPTHPYGTHASVVEVDTDTGQIRLLAHVAVDDCGVALDDASVEGQQHGGAVSGISTALWEEGIWDSDGLPRTMTFAEYLLPTTAELPMIDTIRPAIPTARNDLGVRGIGENGAIAAPASVLNAAIDALSPVGVADLQIPLTPEQVWRALR